MFTKSEKIYYEKVTIFFVDFEKYIDSLVIYFYTNFRFGQGSTRLSK